MESTELFPFLVSDGSKNKSIVFKTRLSDVEKLSPKEELPSFTKYTGTES